MLQKKCVTQQFPALRKAMSKAIKEASKRMCKICGKTPAQNNALFNGCCVRCFREQSAAKTKECAFCTAGPGHDQPQFETCFEMGCGRQVLCCVACKSSFFSTATFAVFPDGVPTERCTLLVKPHPHEPTQLSIICVRSVPAAFGFQAVVVY